MDKTYRKIEIVGTSTESLSDAVRNGIAKAADHVDHVSWFEVVEQRGSVEDGRVTQFQVTLKVGFRLE
jgi:flavin-binding protein dodecin